MTKEKEPDRSEMACRSKVSNQLNMILLCEGGAAESHETDACRVNVDNERKV